MRNLAIKTRLILLFVIVSIIPTLTIGILSLNIAYRTTMEKDVQDSIARLELINYRVSEVIKGKHQTTVILAYDDYVRSYCEKADRFDEQELSAIENRVMRQIMSFYDSQLLSSVTLIKNNGEALYYSSGEYSQVQKINAENQIPENLDDFAIFDLWDDAAWDYDEPVIPYKRIVLGKESGEPVAYLIINVKESIFNLIYIDYEVYRGTECFIINNKGIIQSCTNKEKFSLNISSVFGFGMDRLKGTEGFFKTVMNGGEYVITYTFNEQRGLYFMETIPISHLNEGFQPIMILTIIVAALCMFTCIVLGYLLSLSFTKPLHRLIDRISAHENEGYNINNKSKNEFIILSDKYDKIIEHLERIIHEKYEEQKKKKEAEIRALEFQINPHFLYNTLSTIVWLIEKGERKRAIKITKDLSAYFRISISKGKEFISLEEELKHVGLYVNIQKARYEDKIFFECNVPEELYDYYIPKLILQPLVENSIIHTMKNSNNKEVVIKISGYSSNGDIVLEVRDNGKNIEEATIDEMNHFLRDRTAEAKGKEYGIGISNVHDRINIFFGSGYGLSYQRINNETVAHMVIKSKRERT